MESREVRVSIPHQLISKRLTDSLRLHDGLLLDGKRLGCGWLELDYNRSQPSLKQD